MKAHLIVPTVEMADAYEAFEREFVEAGEGSAILHWPDEPDGTTARIRRLRDFADGNHLPSGWVAMSTFWLLDGREIVGEIRIRHRLSPALEDFGGHIGYNVRPSQRRKGYATRMLALGLEEARRLRLTGVLLTCDPANIGSVRVIERNGGRLLSQSPAHSGRMTSRYWIDL